MIKKCKNLNSSFSLIEIIIVLFLIALISGLMVVILKPGTFFQRARDTKRVSDLSKIEEIFQAKKFSDLSFSENKFLDPKIVYISLPDSSSTCGSWLSELPSLPSSYSYRCSATPTNIDGTGWIPLDFQGITSENFLPIDPINKPPYYYTFVVGGSYEIEAKMENNFQISFNDGGDSGFFYEKGSNLKLTPFEARGGLRFTREEEEKFLNNVCPTCFQGLVGYWTFDEGNGTTTKDLSGYGNDGTLVNGPTWTTGKVGGALSFDGSDDYVNIVDFPNTFNFNGPFSISVWIKQNSSSGFRDIISNYRQYLNPTNHGMFLEIGTADKLRFVYRNNGTNVFDFQQTTSISIGTWQHVVAVYNPSLPSANAKVYLNGLQMSVTANANSTFSITGRPLVIGSIDAGAEGFGRYWNGLIDDVRIYNRALSDAEIKALYQAAN
jgi:hypothetical protein